MKRMLVVLALVGTACAHEAQSNPEPDAHQLPNEQQQQAGACPTAELAFTQEAGCVNDGSVEFCLPQGQEELLATVVGIAPSVHCAPGHGRAECDLATEVLCFYPMSSDICTERHGALNDDAWAELCDLAALPEIDQIVATWFE